MSSSVKELYNKYKSIPLDTWKKQNQEELAKMLKEIFPTAKGVKAEGTVFVLAAKVAHSVSEQEFGEFISTGELPPMKLNAEEMNALRGGAHVLGLAKSCRTDLRPRGRRALRSQGGR
jgi:hypothetical protein